MRRNIFPKTLSAILITATMFSPPINTFARTIEMDLPSIDNSFKTYMSYTAITDKSSIQWDMQQSATTADNGIRMHDDRYMVAVGTYYSKECGEKFNIYLDNGHILYCVTGDIKANKDTDCTNRYIEDNGNIIEFIVNTSTIDNLARKMGDMSYSDNLDGSVVKIEKVVK